MTDDTTLTDVELRDRAVKQIKKRRDFTSHLLVYLLVNTFLIGVWAVSSGGDGHFWPIYVILGWGIGLVANAYDVYVAKPISEEEISREMEHLTTK